MDGPPQPEHTEGRRPSVALAGRTYATVRGGVLVLPLLGCEPAPPLAQLVHAQLRALVLNPAFPCLGARAAFNQQAYRFGMYAGLGSDDVAWDTAVSSDPDDPRFAFSFGGRAFFLIGLHPGSSRWARRFAWPTIVFNAHHQFERLRTTGRYDPLQAAIRDRDTALQGSTNPTLAAFGTASEARQYAGRAVEPDWRCPFSAGRGDD